jgi:hypothetical protein
MIRHQVEAVQRRVTATSTYMHSISCLSIPLRTVYGGPLKPCVPELTLSGLADFVPLAVVLPPTLSSYHRLSQLEVILALPSILP